MSRRAYGTLNIEQRGPTTWRLRWRAPGPDGKLKQMSETVKGSESKANKRANQISTSLETGDFIAKNKMTVREFLDKWFEDYVLTNCTEKTAQGYRQLIDCYGRDIANRQVQTLTTSNIQSVYSKMTKRGLQPTTVRAVHRMIHKALETGVEWEILKRNVSDGCTPPKIVKNEMKIWDAESRAKFFDFIKAHKYSDLLVFSVLTGARRGEICGLTWENVDLSDHRISIVKNIGRINGKGLISRNPKTNRSRRSLALSPPAVKLLHEVRGKQLAYQSIAGDHWHATGYVFTQPDGKPIDPDLVTKAFNKMVKEAGVPHLTPHGLRHAYASACLELGVSPKTVSQHLGHASISTTYDIYAHVIPELEDEAVRKVAEKLLGK